MKDLQQISNAKTPTFYFKKSCDFTVIKPIHIDFIKKVALDSGMSARICLHRSVDSDLHNMVIVHLKGAYIRPHKNPKKSKAYHIIEGSMRVIGINDAQEKLFDTVLENDEVLRIEPNIYLLLLPLSEMVVFHEIALGPFSRDGLKTQVYAPFSPENNMREKIFEFVEYYRTRDIDV